MLAKKLTFTFASQAMAYAINIATSIVVARIMGPAVLGTFSSALALATLFAVVANHGLAVAHLRILPQAEDKAACNGSFLAAKLCFMAVGMLALFAYIRWAEFPGDEIYRNVLYVCAFSILFDQLTTIPVATFNANLLQRNAEVANFSGSLVKNLLKVGAAMAGFGAIALGFSEAAGAFIGMMLAWALFRSMPVGRPSGAVLREYLTLSLPFFLINFSQMVAQNLDKVIIKNFYIGELASREVGIYTAGSRFGSVLNIFLIVASVIFFPTFAKLAKERNFERIHQILRSYQNMVICLFMPICFSLALFSLPIVLFLVGEQYRASCAIMQTIIVGMFFMLLFQPFNLFLSGGLGKIRLMTWVHLAYALLNGVLFLTLIPVQVAGVPMAGLGAMGAAIGSAIAYAAIGFTSKLLANRYIQVPIAREYAAEFVLLALLYGGGTLVLPLIHAEGILTAMLGVPLFLAAFWGLVFAFRTNHMLQALGSLAGLHPFFSRFRQAPGAGNAQE